MMADADKTAPQQPSLEGRYANAFQVGHNAFEFVLDFSQQFVGADDALAHTRIVTSPHYAKGLLETLQTSIAQYEREFGRIADVAGE
jgi:hypothetical protein